MKKTARFNTEEAAFLAEAASKGQLVSYGHFAKKFGGIPQGQGHKLTAMGVRLRQEGLPLLPVLVVNQDTGIPSADAKFYKVVGMEEEDLKAEQSRCFAYDWTKEPFWKEQT